MPRNGSGTYTLPTGNPVSPGTTIESAWANTTLSDIGTELTNSLSRTGAGGMLAAFRLADGTLAAPGVAFLNETGTGLYRAGSGEMWNAVQGIQIQQYTVNGVLIPTGKTFTAQGPVSYTDTLTGGTGVVALGTNQFYKDASGNVGIGTATPGAKLQVYNNINGTPVAWGNAARTGYLYQDANGVGVTNASGTAFDEGIYFDTANSRVSLYTNSTDRVTIDASGNLGLGVTPSAWSSFRGLQVGNTALMGNTSDASGRFLNNTYYDGTNYKRISTGAANMMALGGGGGIQWYLAPSAAAETTITTFGSGSEAMTLDASGNLGIANTAPSQKLDVGATKVTGSFAILGNTTITTTIPVATSTQLGGGLVLIRGADVSGVSFSAVYALAVRLSGGAAPDVAAATVSRAGTATPTFTFGSSGGFVTITSASNGSASYASFIGF